MPYRNLRCCAEYRRLNGFILHTRALSGSADYKSPLYTSSSTEHEQCTWHGSWRYPCVRVVARCGARRLANALRAAEGEKLSTRSNGT